MKVLVTGATGGLGELVVYDLLQRGIRVIATSRDEEKAKKCSFYSQVIYKSFEIGSEKDLDLFEYFEKPDLLIHLAWEKLNDYKNEAHLGSILENNKAFLKNLIQNGLKDVTVVGTCYEYGLQEGELKEEMPSKPVLAYPEGKNVLREYLEQLKFNYTFSLKWARVFYVFGTIKGRKNLYTLLLSAIENNEKTFNMSGGEQVRDFLSPTEIAKNLVAIALQKKEEGIINCCSGKPVKLKQVVNDFLLSKNYQLEINYGFYPYLDYEPMVSWGANRILMRILKGK
jgi:nucleoside-diphosphate-sugar epimerase